jgi:hypothetical protein
MSGRMMRVQPERRKGVAVLDELIRQLRNRESIGRMLNELAGRNPETLVTQLVDELERILSRRHLQHELLTKVPDTPSPVDNPESEPSPPPAATPVSPAATPVSPAATPVSPAATPMPPAATPMPSEVTPMPSVTPAEPAPERAEIPSEQVIVPEVTMQTSDEEESATRESDVSLRKQVPRVPSDVRPDDLIYLHGVCRIEPDDSASAFPFLLEEKGIDNRNFAFALDYRGLRFYGSTVQHDSITLTKNGMLLLGKQEKIRLRGAHESILNDLRLHGILLPFEFGTVLNGPVELTGKIDAHLAAIKDSLHELLETRWWNLTAYALDSRTADLVGSATVAARREIDRGRVPYSSSSQTKRIDVKTLERILNKQKKAAESIHETLQPYAVRSDIDMMVNLQSGSSDEWKVILKASYELGPSMLNTFVRKVTDMQYQHFLMELMLSLTGNVEHFSFGSE